MKEPGRPEHFVHPSLAPEINFLLACWGISQCHPSLIPGLGRSPGEGSGNPLQYSCLVNPMDRRAWCATVHGVAQSWT